MSKTEVRSSSVWGPPSRSFSCSLSCSWGRREVGFMNTFLRSLTQIQTVDKHFGPYLQNIPVAKHLSPCSLLPTRVQPPRPRCETYDALRTGSSLRDSIKKCQTTSLLYSTLLCSKELNLCKQRGLASATGSREENPTLVWGPQASNKTSQAGALGHVASRGD